MKYLLNLGLFASLFAGVLVAVASGQVNEFHFNWLRIDNSKYPEITATFSVLDPNYRIAIISDIDTSTNVIDSASGLNLTHHISLPQSIETVPDHDLIDTTLTNVNIVVNDGLALMVMIDNSASARDAYGSGCSTLKQVLHSMLNVLQFPKDYVTIRYFNDAGVVTGLTAGNSYDTINTYIDNIDNVIGSGAFTVRGFFQSMFDTNAGFNTTFFESFDSSYHIGHYHGLYISGSTKRNPYVDEQNDRFGDSVETGLPYNGPHPITNGSIAAEMEHMLTRYCGLIMVCDSITDDYWTHEADDFVIDHTHGRDGDQDTGIYKERVFCLGSAYAGWHPKSYVGYAGRSPWIYYPDDNASYFANLWSNFQTDVNGYQAPQIEHQVTFTVPSTGDDNTVLIQNVKYGIADTLHVLHMALAVNQSGTDKEAIVLYPNPAAHVVMISGDVPGGVFSLIDAKGEIVATGKLGQILPVDNLSQGVYQILIQGVAAGRLVIVH